MFTSAERFSDVVQLIGFFHAKVRRPFVIGLGKLYLYLCGILALVDKFGSDHFFYHFLLRRGGSLRRREEPSRYRSRF